MVTISIAYTSPINTPTGPKSSPKLTHAQVWAGLQHKIRNGQDFVPIIVSTSVLSSHTSSLGNSVVTREVVFKPGHAPRGAGGEKVKEVCESFGQQRVEFNQEDGSKVVNLLSVGSEGELCMTYQFDWRHEEIQEGEGEKVEEQRGKHLEMAKRSVESSIESLRRLLADGTIKA